MKHIKIIIAFSCFLNVILITNWIMTNNRIDDTISRQAFKIHRDLVELESSITYQSDHNWKEENLVLEKIEDVQEDINSLKTIGKDIGRLSRKQEEDLWNLYNYLLKFPEYSGFPNKTLSTDERKLLEKLSKDLRQVGWGMNIGYSGGWESFSEKLNNLLRQDT
ncbi:hypothetical protein [Paenibacillus eucommiae]|uniref:Uncharacterized protein n=1 Tax=Paenibacillus eucommiae TaxID=1355755 RepID=A0ABS4IPT7_9BACL|nr:hypothetical protein [Paenibacillus eucommiae]MBP1989567.1 hypothetical protein [Paenibacillus eucommiae]